MFGQKRVGWFLCKESVHRITCHMNRKLT